MSRPTRTIEEFEQRYKDMLGFTPPKIAKRLKLGMRTDPELLGALEDWRLAALTPEALDQKTVQLMCFAILLAQTSEAAANHARAAVKAGASRQELHATAGLAALFRGLAAFNMAGEIINELFPETP
ncbi:MAG: carboxymuconolactone decarboxylase family protein [Rhodopseudomonas sp.]|nr:carboxymuconolactone decarboxylase family protein [Rhodopseudomonas sp.]